MFATHREATVPGPLRLVDVHGPSMVPALRHGDRLLVWLRASRRTPSVGRLVGRPVLVDLPDGPLSVKRLVAVEADGSLRVEGDNEFASTDSRTLGPLPSTALRGIVLARVWPHPRRL
jgi:phage repressor protein C with HTH and peptisase S24 domain